MHKYVVQFRNPTPTIFWYAKRAKLTFKYASTTFNPIQTMLMFLAVTQTQCIIYRPDLHSSQASRKKLKK